MKVHQEKRASDDFFSWHRFLFIKENILKKNGFRELFQTLVVSVVLLYSGPCDHMKCVCVCFGAIFTG